MSFFSGGVGVGGGGGAASAAAAAAPAPAAAAPDAPPSRPRHDQDGGCCPAGRHSDPAGSEHGSHDSSAVPCWICLEAGADDGGEMLLPCKCPRPVHPKCLARWQLQSAGKTGEFSSGAVPLSRARPFHRAGARPRLARRRGREARIGKKQTRGLHPPWLLFSAGPLSRFVALPLSLSFSLPFSARAGGHAASLTRTSGAPSPVAPGGRDPSPRNYEASTGRGGGGGGGGWASGRLAAPSPCPSSACRPGLFAHERRPPPMPERLHARGVCVLLPRASACRRAIPKTARTRARKHNTTPCALPQPPPAHPPLVLLPPQKEQTS